MFFTNDLQNAVPHHCCETQKYNISEVLLSTGNLNLELQMLKAKERGKRTSDYKISVQGLGTEAGERKGWKKELKKSRIVFLALNLSI